MSELVIDTNVLIMKWVTLKLYTFCNLFVGFIEAINYYGLYYSKLFYIMVAIGPFIIWLWSRTNLLKAISRERTLISIKLNIKLNLWINHSYYFGAGNNQDLYFKYNIVKCYSNLVSIN